MDLLGGYDSGNGSGSGGSDNDGGGGHVQGKKRRLDVAAEVPTGPGPVPVTKPSLLVPSVTNPRMAAGVISAPQPTLVSHSRVLAARNAHHQSVGTNNKTGGVLMNNPLKEQLMAPVHGPLKDPNANTELAKGQISLRMEQNDGFDELTFDEQRKQFQKKGLAMGPNATGEIVGYHDPKDSRFKAKEADVKRHKIRELNQVSTQQSLVEGSDDEATHGVWAPPSAEEHHYTNDALTDVQASRELAPEQLAEREYQAEKARRRGLGDEEGAPGREAQNFDKMVERKMSHLLPPRFKEEDPTPFEAVTKFHGKEEYNYKGQSWMEPPPDAPKAFTFEDIQSNAANGYRAYVPKKCVHRFTGHTQGVHRIRLFPQTGHLLLSAGLDHKVKVWSLAQKQCMRTYHGHSAAVRDVQFSDDGTKFLSASFDRFIRLWDTETGKVLNTFTNRRVPYVVKFYPHDNNTFVVGCSDFKIVAFDCTTGEITQEYNHHLAAVNTITFCENASKMITSADDRKILVWEWDIGVPIKYISDPTMHSMPVITKHPSDLFLLGQSLDNAIMVYQAQDRYSLQRKKKFQGHRIAGYACDIGCSPDGRFVVSGDGEGKLVFWDYKSQRMLQKYRAHDKGPTIGCVWHPTQPSTVISCGWDGVIKMWE
jgi:pre-mRNA-processing factor 17